jgi:tetratricopeptide (TPR) repeat protein
MNRGHRNAADIQRILDAAAVQFPDSELIMASTALYFAAGGNLAAAAELFERLSVMKPSTAAYHASLADVYMRMERDTDAVAEARKALALEPGNPVAQYFMGRLFFELGQNDEASQAFEAVVQSGEDVPDARFFFAMAEARRGRNESAVAALRRLIETDPDNFQYQSELANTLAGATRYEEAVAPFQKAVQLQPKDLKTKAGLGMSLFESGRFPEGIAVLEEADRMQPGNQVVAMFLQVARTRQQGVPQIDEMKRFAKENPQDVNVRMSLVQLLAYTRRIKEAGPYVADIYKLNPKDVRFYQHIGVAYSTAGEFDKAIDAYRRSFEVEENPAGYLGLAGIYQKAGRADDASRAYAKVLELKPDSPNIAKLYADHLRDTGKRREALEMYKRTLTMLPLNAPALFNAGMLSAKLGDVEGARGYLGPLKTVDPALAKSLERCIRLRLWQ